MARYIAPALSQYQMVTFNFGDLFPPGHATYELLELIRRLDLSKFDSNYDNDSSAGGRPALPVDRMLALILHSLLYGNLSMRQLDRDLTMRADLMFLSAGLHVDHSTLGKFRLRHAEEIKDAFNQTVFLGVEAGLINLDVVCIDSTKIKASANRSDIATREGFETRFQHVKEACQRRFAEWEQEESDEQKTALKTKIDRLERAKTKIQAGIEFLNEHTDRKRLHLTDADADWHKEGTGMIVGYGAQTAVDQASGMIVHTDVVTGQADVNYTKPMVAAVEALKSQAQPERTAETKYVLDCGYASEAHLKDLQDRDIYMPDRKFARETIGGKLPPAEREATLDAEASARAESLKFTYFTEDDSYECPNGQRLGFKREKLLEGAPYREYHATGCSKCPLQSACAGEKASSKSIWVPVKIEGLQETKLVASKGNKRIFEAGRNPFTEAMRAKLATLEGRRIYGFRMPTVEGTFGVIKNARQGWRFLRRGLDRVGVDWAERCLAFNVAKLLAFHQTATA